MLQLRREQTFSIVVPASDCRAFTPVNRACFVVFSAQKREVVGIRLLHWGVPGETVYDFVHYHSQIHEVLGVARGTAEVELGGVRGRTLALKAGDVAILPAGTGHRLIKSNASF